MDPTLTQWLAHAPKPQPLRADQKWHVFIIDDALSVLATLADAFPRAVRPRQLRGLAFARRGDLLAAQQVLGELYAAGEVGPQTLGMYARTWMDRYWRVATAAESRLVQADCRGAAELYVKAVSMAPEELGSHRATRDQAVALRDALEVARVERDAVLAAFAHLRV